MFKSYNATSFSWDDIVYRMYENSGHVASAYEYGCGVYANALEEEIKYNIM